MLLIRVTREVRCRLGNDVEVDACLRGREVRGVPYLEDYDSVNLRIFRFTDRRVNLLTFRPSFLLFFHASIRRLRGRQVVGPTLGSGLRRYVYVGVPVRVTNGDDLVLLTGNVGGHDDRRRGGRNLVLVIYLVRGIVRLINGPLRGVQRLWGVFGG